MISGATTISDMDHTRQHKLAGKRVTLSLKRPHPMSVLYSGQIVRVLDWSDRQTGMPWSMMSVERSGEGKTYLNRLGADFRDDADVVAVAPDGQRGHSIYLIHDSEIGREVPG